MARRELLINVDDIGIHEGAVAAAVETITDGVAASGSVMTVVPTISGVLDLLESRPEVPLGIHLTLIQDIPGPAWVPLTGGQSIQNDGRFLPYEQRERLLAQANGGEVEAEFRAQIEVLIAAGRQPTHLDWHCLADGGREDIFDLTMALAEEYQIAIRAWTSHGRQELEAQGYAVQSQPFLDSFTVPAHQRQQYFLDLIRSLPAGLTEWAMHPALPVPSDAGSNVRELDHKVLLAPAIRQALIDEEITVVGYGDVSPPPMARPRT